jgi:hypothetical protein
MLTLHDTIDITKKALLYGAIGAGVIFVLFLLFRFGVFVKNTFFPPPPPPFQAEFGTLPAMEFEKQEKNEYTYTLDTLSGDYPSFPDRLLVYKLNHPSPEFYDLARAKIKANNIGFTGQPFPILENVYQWSENFELQRKLIMNIVTKDFALTSAYKTYPAIETANNLGNEESAIKTASSFLETLNSFPQTINPASTSARLYSLQNGKVVDATSVDNAQLIRIDFYRKTVNALPIYYPHSPESLIHILVGGGTTEPIVVEAEYYDQEVSEESTDYPIKTAKQAFTELSEGKGYIASYYGDAQDIKIKDIQLGYYLSKESQQYLMPVVVFQGDGFIAYVPAVADEFME